MLILQLSTLLAVVPLFIVSRSILAPTRLLSEIPSLRSCAGVENNSMIVDTPITSSLKGRGNYTINGAFNITRNSRRIVEIRFELTRCRDVVSSNTCEHFHTWRLQRSPCRAFMDPEAPWAGLKRGIVEDYRCPTKQGIYHFEDAALDMKALTALNLPLEGAVWRAKMFIMEAGESIHYCMEGDFIFHRTRA